MSAAIDTVVDLYERHAVEYDRARSRSLQEREWLDRFLAYVRPEGTVLDLGCGAGEPLARYVLESGRRVVGIDAAPAMIELCRARFPEAEWMSADMRDLELHRQFDGILAWDSLFHLPGSVQRAIFPRITRHARRGAPFLFTSGPSDGEVVGDCFGERLYHASLGPVEYAELLRASGFVVREHVAEDTSCGDHTVWLATLDT